MVLESLTDPLRAERRPYRMFFFGLLASTVAVWLSLLVYRPSPDSASLAMVFFTVLACVPLMYNTMKVEELKDESIIRETALLKEHTRAMLFFIFLFVGIVTAMTFWYIMLSPDVSGSLFSSQLNAISGIRAQAAQAAQAGHGSVTGLALSPATAFGIILKNNLRVLAYAALFAFVFGVGAIFILTWNASVIAAAVGTTIKAKFFDIAGAGGSTSGAYFESLYTGIARYFPHGIPEILGYFIGGLGVGILSVAIIKPHLDYEKLRRILLDSSELLLIAVVVLIIAAFIEVFITPWLVF